MLSKKLEDLAFWSNATQSDIYKLFLPLSAESVFSLMFLQTKWRNKFVLTLSTAAVLWGLTLAVEDNYILS